MSTHHICRPNGQPEGPYTIEQIRNMWANGQIITGTQIWIESGKNAAWCPIEAWAKPQKKGGCSYSLLAVFAAILFIILVAVGVVQKDDDSDVPLYKSGFYAGQSFVKKGLKSPSTAKFPSYSEEGSFGFVRKDGLCEAGGFVDAQNSFGATIRSEWRTVCRLEGGNWRLVWMRIGNETTGGTYPKDTPGK